MECKYCNEPELEWFFDENASKYKLGRKIDVNVYIPHKCKTKETKKEIKPYPWRYVSSMCLNICTKHKIELTEMMKCKICGFEKICFYIGVESKILKYPYRFKYEGKKEIRDYDITVQDVMNNNLIQN